MSKPYTHLLEVEMRVLYPRNAVTPKFLDLVMPVWTPGSYLIREYARHVQDFVAKDGASGKAIEWTKVNKNTWRLGGTFAHDILITYRVYANELTVRSNEFNDQHAFWNNAALLMYPANGYDYTDSRELKLPATVRVIPYGNWRVATGLPPVEGQPNTFRAENFDILYDSPFEVSDFKTLTFDVRGIPHRIVIDGLGNYDAERVRNDAQKIVNAAVETMGGEIPYHDYTFILHLRQTGGGGLEHLNSTALGFRRFGFRPEASYQGFLSLVAHEFFHLWNVKRIRPDALGPFDYTKENYTRLLWVAEGITSYYEELILRRAGLISDKEYLNNAARSLQALQNTPGRLVMSVEEASFDAWIKYYRPDENSINSQISYYDKGAILGLLLDLEIRRRSQGQKSLDDVMRYLYNEFYKKNRNYRPEDFQQACELMAGSNLNEFFTRFVRGRDELDYNASLTGVGLQLVNGAVNIHDDVTAKSMNAYLGADLEQQGDRLVVTRVLAGTPAYEQGLYAGDQIVAVDGVRATRDFLNARLAEKQPNDSVTFAVFRADDLRNLTIKLGGRAEEFYRIVAVAQPSAAQARLYQEWMGAPLVQQR